MFEAEHVMVTRSDCIWQAQTWCHKVRLLSCHEQVSSLMYTETRYSKLCWALQHNTDNIYLGIIAQYRQHLVGHYTSNTDNMLLGITPVILTSC